MLLSWKAGCVQNSANFELLDPVDGLIEDVLEGTLELFLLGQKLFDVVLSASLELGECLFGGFFENFGGSLLLAIGFLAARFIDLPELQEFFFGVEFELINDMLLLCVETSDG